MIKAEHSWFHHLFFRNYFRYILWKDFRKTEIRRNLQDKGLPILIIGNHISWWDGFFVYELNRKVFKRKFYLMMLEEQLSKRLFFRRLGAFSINPGSRSVIESLNYAGEILESNKNLLILFPQGKIHSLYTSEIDFQKGWFRIIKNAVSPVQIIFLANLTDYFSYRKPSLVTYLEEYTKTENFVLDEIAVRYNDFYQKCLDHQKKMV